MGYWVLSASFAVHSVLRGKHAALIKKSMETVPVCVRMCVYTHTCMYLHVHSVTHMHIYVYTVAEYSIYLSDCGLITGPKFDKYFMYFISRIKAQ